MKNLARIVNAVEYIEQNLTQSLSLKDIASESCLSEFYFHKLFHVIVGDPPGEYIKKRRLYEAALSLKEGKRKIIDIAYEYGYQSPEAFSRAFSNYFGYSPSEIKKNSQLTIRYTKSALTLTHLTHIHKGVIMEPKITRKDEIKLVGPVYYGDNKNDEIPEFWKDNFNSVTSIATKKNDDCYGFCFQGSDYVKKGRFNYMPAVEVTDFSIIPPAKTIPAPLYALFTHTTGGDSLGETYKYIHSTWFPHKKYALNEDFDFEYYTRDENGKAIIELHVPIKEK